MRGMKQKLINGKIPVYYPEDYVEKGVNAIIDNTKVYFSKLTLSDRIAYGISKKLEMQKLEALSLCKTEEDIEAFLKTYPDSDFSNNSLSCIMDFLDFLNEKPNIIEIKDGSIKYLDRDGYVQLEYINFVLVEKESIHPEHYGVEFSEYRKDTFHLVHYKQIEVLTGNDEGHFQTKEVQQEDSKSNNKSECTDYSEQEKYIKKLEFMLKSSGTPILDIEHAEKVIKEIEELGNKEHAIHLDKKAWVRTEDVINIIHKYFS